MLMKISSLNAFILKALIGDGDVICSNGVFTLIKKIFLEKIVMKTEYFIY